MDFKLEIGFFVGGSIAFTGQTAAERDLGGSEYAAVKLAEALADRGHQVTLFTKDSEEVYPDGLPVWFRGVQYIPTPRLWLSTMRHKNWDVFIVSRDYGMLTNSAITTKQLVLWNHDVLSDKEAFLEHIYPLDRMYCVSDWQKQQYLEKINDGHPDPVLRRSAITVTRNGVDVDGIREALNFVDGRKFNNPTFMYSSRPERGLLYLLRDIWPHIRAKIPNAELLVCSYNVNQELLPDAIKQIHQECELYLQTDESVKPLGHLPRHELYRVTAACHAVLYPSIFPETSCLTALETQALGIPIFSSNYAALATTNRNAQHHVFDKYAILAGDVGHFEEAAFRIRKYIESYNRTAFEERRRHDQQIILSGYSWAKIAEEWENDAYDHFEVRAFEKPKKIIQNLIYNSDLLAAKWALLNMQPSSDPQETSSLTSLMSEVSQHLDHHHAEPEQYGNLVDAGEAEDITECPSRMVMALDLIEKRFGDQPFTLLDCGCGTGRFLYHAMKRFPAARVMGLDFADSCLRRADANLRKLLPHLKQPTDVCEICGESRIEHHSYEGRIGYFRDCIYSEPEILPFLVRGDFLECSPPVTETGVDGAVLDERPDVVWAGEWLEHQIELQRALEHVNAWCKPGGLVIYSVPNGPWEALSYGTTFTQDNHEIRSHVSHFEERDLQEMFSETQEFTLEYAYIQRSAIDNAPLGQFVVSYKAVEGMVFHLPNYQRKFLTTRPRPTIGAAIIARDEEHNILRAIKPLVKRVDALYVGDTGSSDLTVSLAEKYATVVDIGWDMQTGFSGARNMIRDHMTDSEDLDWIIWMDCDEEWLDIQLLRQYTQGDLEIYQAFVITQNHLMMDVPLTFDGPMRLFRNKDHYRWHGLIHEQVMDLKADPEGNKVVFPSLVIADTKIAHYGYKTEGDRRWKLLKRNLPLLKLDRQINPNRELGKLFEMRDYINTIRWYIEKNAELPFEPVHLAMIQAVIDIYQEFKDTSHQNHALAHVFYQDVLRFLGERQIPYKGQVPFQVANLLVGSPGELQPASLRMKPVSRWFLTMHEIEMYLADNADRLVKQLRKSNDLFAL